LEKNELMITENVQNAIETTQAEEVRFRSFKYPSPFQKCLVPLLDALNWNGSERDLLEAMPVETDVMGLDGFLATIASLNYECRTSRVSLQKLDLRLLPCLFIRKNGNVSVIIRHLDNAYMVFDGATGRFDTISIRAEVGTAVFFRPVVKSSGTLQQPGKYWFWKTLSRFKNLLILGALLTLILTIFSFIAPLFIMAIYDQVLTSDTSTMLEYLGAGVLIFIVGELGFKLLRADMFNFISVRLGNIAGNEILRRILYLPAAYTESASTGSQLSRIRDFDSIQNFFNGPPILSLYDLPFTLLLVVGLLLIGGSLAMVPLISILLFILFFIVIRPFMQRAVEEASRAGTQRHEFIIDFLTSFRAVKTSSHPAHWGQRFRELSSEAVTRSFQIEKLTVLINTGTQFLVTGTGLTTMTVGIFLVLDGKMSAGALMASILLVWRILAPLRSGFGVLNQIDKIRKSITQVDRLMNMELERVAESNKIFRKQQGSSISVSQLSMRYSADANPALIGVSFDAKQGETLVVIGPDGTGKTTLLKLLMGLFRPQTGRIIIGDMNIRQLDPINLRHEIAYLPQENDVFDGSIAQNLLLAKPEATNNDLMQAAAKAGILKEIEQSAEGFETVIDRDDDTRSMIRGLGLAQVFLQQASIYLIDEPEKGLNPDTLPQILEAFDQLRRNATVIIVTRHREIMELAKRILWLENNRVKMFDLAEKVLKRYDQSIG
jgi:ATP-binding cassette, subfamily C, bacterial LapB